MKRNHIDNFYCWRELMKEKGKIKSQYNPLVKDGDLSELIGVTLGDGHLCVYQRTEELRIISNSNNLGFIKRYSRIIKKVFKKYPYIHTYPNSQSTRIGLYEKHISNRIGISTGARKNLTIKIPNWILKDKKYIVRYLRGLYEAEGSFNVHKPTCTYKFSFSNVNESMLNNVLELMKKLGFHPHKSNYQIQLSRKEEVYKAMKVLKFRDYN